MFICDYFGNIACLLTKVADYKSHEGILVMAEATLCNKEILSTSGSKNTDVCVSFIISLVGRRDCPRNSSEIALAGQLCHPQFVPSKLAPIVPTSSQHGGMRREV